MTINLVSRDITTGEIGLDGGRFAKNLLCPACGDNYLHHKAVTAYDRKPDEPTVVRTRVSEGIVTREPVPNNDDNPSPRRHGLVIDFWCEGCTADPIQLRIGQHKGVSELSWRYVTHPERDEVWVDEDGEPHAVALGD